MAKITFPKISGGKVAASNGIYRAPILVKGSPKVCKGCGK